MGNCAISPQPDKWWIILLVVLMLLMIGVMRAGAHSDTLSIKKECVEKVISKPSKNGKSVKYYAIIRLKDENDKDYKEIVTVSKTVIEYLDMCKEYGLRPHLAVRYKDDSPYSLIKKK